MDFIQRIKILFKFKKKIFIYLEINNNKINYNIKLLKILIK